MSVKVSEVVIWQNGNVMAFNENGRQVGECQGCILDPKLIHRLNGYCDEETKFSMAVCENGRTMKRYEMDLNWWFKKKKEGEVK
jgi:hypothetical protein